MGNQQSNGIGRRSRYRTLQNKNKSKINSSRRYGESVDDNNIFITPPINRSVAEPNDEDNDQDKEIQIKKKNINDSLNPNVYRSIDVNQSRNGSRAKKKSQNDRILDQLSRKNQQLRKQLKQISDELTDKLKRKKLVPKKKKKDQDEQSENQYDKQANEKQLMGLRRQLENGYKQIQMYKKTIANLKSRQEGITAEHKANGLENDIVIKDNEIQKYLKKIEGIKNIKGKQDIQITRDINDDLKGGIEKYKAQAEQLKDKLKKFSKRDALRQKEYKKQQAYLCDLQKKMREIDGSYFPQLSNHLKKQEQKVTIGEKDKDKEVNPKQFYSILEQARQLRIKHEQYNRKIQNLLQIRNKRIQQQNDLKDLVLYKERIIQALKIKISTLKKLLKPRRTNLFGQGGSQIGSQMQSQYNDNQSQLERQLQQQLNQDQFDIKHLLSNIPKPIRKRPQELSNGYSSGSSEGQRRRRAGLILTSEKSQPKKWGINSIRTEERGKHFKGQLSFQDRAQFEGDVQPIIVGVNIWVNKNNTVLGIQAIYLNQNQLRYGVKSSDSVDGVIRRFDLQSPDYLKNLTLTFGKEGFVQSITLYSKQGKVGKFGNKRSEDQNINFGLASNERPFMFLGASSLYEAEPRLNFFGMQICTQ